MLQIHIIPALSDNYFWLVQPDNNQPDAYILDPGDAEAVRQRVKELGLTLKSIVVTHHHHDHTDGIDELVREFNIPVYGPQSPRIPQVTHPLKDGDHLKLGVLDLQVVGLAGHTLDHIGYYLERTDAPPILFCGDTLFAAGCGRLFDGTADLLFKALQRIAQLPDETIIYCSHEYTLANLRFALYIEPDNADIIARQQLESQKRAQGIATIPTQLSLEKRTNPFLRCHLPHVRKRVEQITSTRLHTTVEIFANLRRAKDQF